LELLAIQGLDDIVVQSCDLRLAAIPCFVVDHDVN